MMGDSDSDSNTVNSVYTFQNQSTSVCGKGPNLKTNLSNLSCRNNTMMQSSNRPWNFERPQYAESVYDQRSIYSRRETSPMSIRSASNMSRNLSRSYYPGGMSSQRSVYNGRSGSPMSIRTMDSNTSVSAIDIATALKTMHFNKHEMRIIRDAYTKHLKGRLRHRVQKRRNIKSFLKGSRRRSGGESGEQGSDSSLSSDDCRSTRSYRTMPCRDNTSRAGSYRSNRADLGDIRRTLQESNIYRDCTDSFKHNSLRNVVPMGPPNLKENLYRPQESLKKTGKDISITQKDRFTTGFVLPSQRFNHSNVSTLVPIYEKGNPGLQEDSDGSDDEEIFSETSRQNNSIVTQNKRSYNDENAKIPEKKKCKLSPPKKRNIKSKPSLPKLNRSLPRNDKKSSDFVFAKPQFPVKKFSSVKNNVSNTSLATQQLPKPPTEMPVKVIETSTITSTQENVKSTTKIPNINDKIPNKKLSAVKTSTISQSQLTKEKVKNSTISQSQLTKENAKNSSISHAELTKEKLISKSKEVSVSQPVQSQEQLLAKSSQPLDTSQAHSILDKEHSELVDSTNLSMRPSFMKRKLFSQKVDMAENKNTSTDKIPDSPQSPQSDVYSMIQREKNKTRKLVTSQSCLNRDDIADESNLLDLIHKFVPSDQFNVTSATNRTEPNIKKCKLSNATDNNTADMSDTYTDEEIFKPNETTKTKKTDIKMKNPVKQKEAKLVVEKLPMSVMTPFKENDKIKQNGIPARNLSHCIKSFWDTDTESEFENHISPIKINGLPANVKKSTQCEKIQTNQRAQITNKLSATNKNDSTTMVKEKIEDKSDHKAKKEVMNISKVPPVTITKPLLTKSPPVNKTISKVNTAVKNVQKVINNSFKPRAPRTPKIRLCSNNDSSSANDSSNPYCRSLRSRNIDLSSSLLSNTSLHLNEKSKMKSKLETRKKIVTKLSKMNDNSLSDLSFTLPMDDGKNDSRSRRSRRIMDLELTRTRAGSKNRTTAKNSRQAKK